MRGGKEYTYWEARITTGRDPGTGKQIQRSFAGKTQKEAWEKLQAAAVAVSDGTYTDPSKLTVGQWLDIWQRDYLGNIKPNTVKSYGYTRIGRAWGMTQDYINMLTRNKVKLLCIEDGIVFDSKKAECPF